MLKKKNVSPSKNNKDKHTNNNNNNNKEKKTKKGLPLPQKMLMMPHLCAAVAAELCRMCSPCPCCSRAPRLCRLRCKDDCGVHPGSRSGPLRTRRRQSCERQQAVSVH